MSSLSHFKESRTGQFWLKYEQKIVLAIGIILITAISFEAGYLHGQKDKQEPIVVNRAACLPAGETGAPCPKNENTDNNTSSANTSQNNTTKNQDQINTDNQKCAFVASKNSNKYHLPTCQFAQKIKPENKVCFSSADEAIKRGYQGAKCCIK